MFQRRETVPSPWRRRQKAGVRRAVVLQPRAWGAPRAGALPALPRPHRLRQAWARALPVHSEVRWVSEVRGKSGMDFSAASSGVRTAIGLGTRWGARGAVGRTPAVLQHPRGGTGTTHLGPRCLTEPWGGFPHLLRHVRPEVAFQCR